MAAADASSPSSQIDLSWSPGSPAATTWEVQHALDAAFTQVTVDTTSQPGSTTTYVKSGVAASTTLYFRVRALGCGSSSAWSNTASATTAASTPPACTAGTANVSPTAFFQSQGSHNYLGQDAVVTLHTTGTCSNLSIRFTPDSSQQTIALTPGSGGVFTATISARRFTRVKS